MFLVFFYAMKVDMEGKEITISNSTDRHLPRRICEAEIVRGPVPVHGRR